MKSMGVPPRKSTGLGSTETRNQDTGFPIRRPTPNRRKHQALLLHLSRRECECSTSGVS
jgi:hypothetical protein